MTHKKKDVWLSSWHCFCLLHSRLHLIRSDRIWLHVLYMRMHRPNNCALILLMPCTNSIFQNVNNENHWNLIRIKIYRQFCLKKRFIIYLFSHPKNAHTIDSLVNIISTNNQENVLSLVKWKPNVGKNCETTFCDYISRGIHLLTSQLKINRKDLCHALDNGALARTKYFFFFFSKWISWNRQRSIYFSYAFSITIMILPSN